MQRQQQPQGRQDKRAEQPHVQTRNRQQMCEVAGAQRLKSVLADAAAVAGRDGRGKTAKVPGSTSLMRSDAAIRMRKTASPA